MTLRHSKQSNFHTKQQDSRQSFTMMPEVVMKSLPINRQWQLYMSWLRQHGAYIFHWLGVTDWNIHFRVTNLVAKISINKHTQTIWPGIIDMLNKPSMKLHTSGWNKFAPRILKQYGGLQNVIGMTALNRTSITDAIYSGEELPKLWQGPSLFSHSQRSYAGQMATKVPSWMAGSVETFKSVSWLSTVYNGLKVRKLNKLNFFCVKPFWFYHYRVLGNFRETKFSRISRMT